MGERLASHRRTARKEHRCFACGEAIGHGTTYLDDRYADDGRAYTLRSHLSCNTIMDREWRNLEIDGEISELAVRDFMEGCDGWDAYKRTLI